VEHLLVRVIQQHRDQGQFSDVFGQFAGEGDEAAAAFGQQFVPVAQAGFKQRGQALRDDGFHIFVGGQRAFFEVNAEAFADPVELELFGTTDEGDRYARCPRAAGAPRAVDVRLQFVGRFVLDDMREFGDVQPARGHVGCHKKAQRPRPNSVQHPFAFGLREIGA